MTVDTNPKSAFGIKKPNLFLVPPAALAHMADGMADGAAKYGAYNWRDNDVAASVYLAAAQRHLLAWQEGEAVASDSGVHHLGHAMSCLAIILDAEHNNNLVDDRPKPTDFGGLLKRLTKD